jgi:hypothetical protein
MDAKTRSHLETIPLQSFQVVGWMDDGRTFNVMLRNGGQRFIFRKGRLYYGGLGSTQDVEGFSGRLNGKKLTLQVTGSRPVTLDLEKERNQRMGLE